jgi:glyoxylase-like metal-dependent hydrolase (beta-lactamase superfamily II)
MVAVRGANIERLLYDRGRHPNRVELELSCAHAAQSGEVLDELGAAGLLAGPSSLAEPDEGPLAITDMAGVLSFKVALENRPGVLATLAGHLKEFGANVTHMCYDMSSGPGMVEASVATSGAAEVSALLGDLNRAGYHYHVLWRGGEDSEINEALGLSGVEAFLFKLRSSLPPERMNSLEELFSTSREVRQALAEFRGASGASGEILAASEVFANILRLAAMAQGSTGERFTLRLSGPVRLTPRVSLYMLTCPEGANSYLLCHPDAMAMLDTNFGVYFDDVSAWLGLHGFDPARINMVLATHPDADHAGWAGRLQSRFGARVYMHPDSVRVFAEEDRTLGRGPLKGINRPFTRLVGRLSGLVPPERIEPFEPADGECGGFPVIGKIRIADLEFLVLESLGGHAAGQVFYCNPELGVLFSGDYLLDAASLSPREREALSVHKSLLTSTNTDSVVFAKEMGMLRAVMLRMDEELHKMGGRAMVFPGHGDFYAVDRAGW